MSMHELPEVGLRAGWLSEVEWRLFLVGTVGRRIDWPEKDNTPLEGLAAHFYFHGPFILPRDATTAEIAEASTVFAFDRPAQRLLPN